MIQLACQCRARYHCVIQNRTVIQHCYNVPERFWKSLREILRKSVFCFQVQHMQTTLKCTMSVVMPTVRPCSLRLCRSQISRCEVLNSVSTLVDATCTCTAQVWPLFVFQFVILVVDRVTNYAYESVRMCCMLDLPSFRELVSIADTNI